MTMIERVLKCIEICDADEGECINCPYYPYEDGCLQERNAEIRQVMKAVKELCDLE